jgi:predicted short-subunit dehydrogenase-like oxidoreductase (DUF2520 family)
MASKPPIAIVGSGRLATALTTLLKRAGYAIACVVARAGDASVKKARRLAREVGARAVCDLAGVDARIIWFCVPDSAIGEAARSFADIIDWKGRIVLHSSGVLTSDELLPLKVRGAAVASAHPLMTFVETSAPPLDRVSFAIEGMPTAVRAARRIVHDLGGYSYSIRKQDKAAYHAWGTFASPLLTALFATTEEVAVKAGVSRTSAKRRMMPILLQTLANYASYGAAKGFSGPLVRGDVETVLQHLHALRSEPVVRDVYIALARAAIEYLPTKNRSALKRALGYLKR